MHRFTGQNRRCFPRLLFCFRFAFHTVLLMKCIKNNSKEFNSELKKFKIILNPVKVEYLPITDKNGTQTVTINDGADGSSPTVTIDESVNESKSAPASSGKKKKGGITDILGADLNTTVEEDLD